MGTNISCGSSKTRVGLIRRYGRASTRIGTIVMLLVVVCVRSAFGCPDRDARTSRIRPGVSVVLQNRKSPSAPVRNVSLPQLHAALFI